MRSVLPFVLLKTQWLRTKTSPRKSTNGLPPIQEGAGLATIKEEDVEPDVVGSTAAAPIQIDMDVDEEEEESLFVSHNDVAQAFSHFSYIFAGRKSVICDLQVRCSLKRVLFHS
jgi:hypothetical protein